MTERLFGIEKKETFHMATIWLMTILVFIGIFANGWTYDDFPVIVENPDVRSLGAFLADAYPGRPLRELTFLLDHALFGLDPYWWHLQQIFWHALNATLIYRLTTKLGGRQTVAWLAAALFAVHPIQVEVVANISHRKDSLALAFSLLSLLSYIRFVNGNRRWLWLTFAAGLWIVALYGKLSAVCLPIAFLAYEYCCADSERRFLLKRPLPSLWAAGAAASAIGALGWFFLGGGRALFLEEARGPLQLKANYFTDPDLATYLLMMLKSWAFIFLKFVLPSELAPEYTYAVPGSWGDPWVLGALAASIALVALLFIYRKNQQVFIPLVLVAVFWLPVSNLWPLTYFAADRYMYAPAAGVVMLFAFLSTQLLRGRTLVGVSVVVLLTLGVLTVQQVRIWHSPWTLWSHAVEVSPRSTFALNNMGNNYLLQEDLDRAMAFYKKSVEANPTNPQAQYNLGLIYERKGAMRKAVRHYRNFVRLEPKKYATEVEALKKRFRFE